MSEEDIKTFGHQKLTLRGYDGCHLLLIISLFLLGLSLAVEAQVGEVKQLKVFSATDTLAIESVLRAFEQSNPDIVIDYREFNTSELHSAVLLGVKPIDVVISSAMDLQTDLVNRGVAHRFIPPNIAQLPGWTHWRNELYGFTREPVFMVYNRSVFESFGLKLPQTRSELASLIRDNPILFDQRIGTYDVNRSGVGYLFATQDAQRGFQYSRLVESFGRALTRSYCCTQQILDDVANGKLVFGYNVIGSYAWRAAEEDSQVAPLLLGDYTLLMTRTALILRDSENLIAAERFVSFLLSSEGQRIIKNDSWLLPLLGDNHTGTNRAGMLDRLADSQALLPIRIGPGLLTWLDTMKKSRFLTDWNAAMLGVREMVDSQVD